MRTYNLNITNWTTINETVPAAAIRPPEIEQEGTTFTFDVQRFAVDTATIESTVTWQIVGSGSNPADAADFPGGVFPSGTLVFAAGEVIQSVDIPVLDDSLFEPDETFDFVLNATGGNPIATGTILNNDTMPNGDFNGDGSYDCDDIDALVANIANQTNIAIYDMNGDGALDLVDLNEWLTVAGSINLPSGNAYIHGDANLDGVVDGQDFIVWNNHKFTSGNGWCGGDFNADGVTDGQDFIVWNDNKFTSSAILDTPTNSVKLARAMTTVGRVAAAVEGATPTTTPITAGIVYKTPTISPSVARRTDAAMADWLRHDWMSPWYSELRRRSAEPRLGPNPDDSRIIVGWDKQSGEYGGAALANHFLCNDRV